jgi:uncharacterized tellurite resistance protein B-like protein
MPRAWSSVEGSPSARPGSYLPSCSLLPPTLITYQMGFFDNFFSSEAKKNRKSHIGNLISVALADGQIDQNEVTFIQAIANRYGLTDSEFKELVSGKPMPFHKPKSTEEQFSQLWDMFMVMIVDNERHPKEIAILKGVAAKFGISTAIVDDMNSVFSEEKLAGFNDNPQVQARVDLHMQMLQLKYGLTTKNPTVIWPS